MEVCLSLSPFACVLIAMCHHMPHFFLSFSLYIYIYIYVRISTYHAFLSLLFCVLQAEPELISIYHPMAKEVFVAMGTPMEGFFNRADMVAETMASTAPTVAQEVLSRPLSLQLSLDL